MENLANNRPLPLEGNEFLLKQSFEIAEMFDIETRNKYNVYGSDGQQIMHVAEQQKGLIGYLFRQMRGHRARRFSLHFYDMKKNLLYLAKHPYCWFFQTLEVYDSKDKLLGTLKTRFAFLKSKVDVLDSNGNLLWQMQTKMNIFFHRWQFPFFRDGKQIACIDKKFSGIFEEVMTDMDDFILHIDERTMTPDQKILLIAAGVFFDIRYFEVKK